MNNSRLTGLRFLFIFTCLIAARMSFSQSDTSAKYSWMAKNDTTIIGKAFNAKAGAVIVDIYERTYYVEGVERWEEKFDGKLLKVKGRLAKMRFPGGELPADPDKPLVQSMEGDLDIITSPQWSIMKSKSRKKKEATRRKG